MTKEQALMIDVEADERNIATAATLPHTDLSPLVAQCAARYLAAQPFGRNSLVRGHAEANLRWAVELWAAHNK